jgi:hypothetical protein
MFFRTLCQIANRQRPAPFGGNKHAAVTRRGLTDVREISLRTDFDLVAHRTYPADTGERYKRNPLKSNNQAAGPVVPLDRRHCRLAIDTPTALRIWMVAKRDARLSNDVEELVAGQGTVRLQTLA